MCLIMGTRALQVAANGNDEAFFEEINHTGAEVGLDMHVSATELVEVQQPVPSLLSICEAVCTSKDLVGNGRFL